MYRLIIIVGVIIGIAGAFLPVWRPVLPTVSNEPAEQDASAQVSQLSLAVWQSRFDLSELTPVLPPTPQQPQVNPAAVLKQWQLTGIIYSDSISLAILLGPEGRQYLRQGEELAGFVLSKIEPNKITFTKGVVTEDMLLPESPSG